MKRSLRTLAGFLVALIVAFVLASSPRLVEEPNGLTKADRCNELGNRAADRGDFAAAELWYRRALELRRRLAPGSREVAASLNNLGLMSLRRGHPDAAESYHRRALALKEALALEGTSVAISLLNLGNVSWYRGDLSTAEDRYRRAMTLFQEDDPQSLDVARCLNNLGLLAWQQGGLAGAEALLSQALELKERQNGSNRSRAHTLRALAAVLGTRGQLAEAEAFLLRGLALQRSDAADGIEVAETLINLAYVAYLRDDLATAEERYTEALAIHRRHAPEGQNAALALQGLGLVAHHRGDPATARELFATGLTLLAEGKAENLHRADLHRHLALAARDEEDLAAAEDHLLRALSMFEVLAPGSVHHALALHDLGDLRRRGGDGDEALVLYRGAVEVLETQLPRLGGDWEQEARFRADHLALYGDLLDLLVARGDLPGAFAVLERSRARSLLTLLAGRDPGAADPRDLRPTSLPALRRALEPGALLLTWWIGRDRSHLFAVPASGEGRARVFTLDVEEETLRRRIKAFRRSIGENRLASTPAGGEDAALRRQLYELLLGPADGMLQGARYLLLSPDGPLHTLPFAALERRGERAEERYLGTWKPFTVILSASLYARGRNQAGALSNGASSLVAFGDPDLPASAVPSVEDPSFLAHRRPLPPLPGSRREVEAIATLFPEERVRVFVGSEATEQRFRALPPTTTHVHFAGHAVLDEGFPLRSSLLFSPSPVSASSAQDGTLEASEILRDLHLDADLVTLSACRSGLGQEVRGEGMIGLAWVFFHAGARSLLVSLWDVEDRSTEELMAAFYGALRAGERKDEALRQARLQTQRSGPSQPHHWAGFRLMGNGR